MPGFLINLKPKEKEVSQLILLYGNSSLRNTHSPSLMPPDIEISSRI